MATSNASTHTNYLIQLLKSDSSVRDSLISTATRQSGSRTGGSREPDFRPEIGYVPTSEQTHKYTRKQGRFAALRLISGRL